MPERKLRGMMTQQWSTAQSCFLTLPFSARSAVYPHFLLGSSELTPPQSRVLEQAAVLPCSPVIDDCSSQPSKSRRYPAFSFQVSLGLQNYGRICGIVMSWQPPKLFPLLATPAVSQFLIKMKSYRQREKKKISKLPLSYLINCFNLNIWHHYRHVMTTTKKITTTLKIISFFLKVQ